jgi:protein involved in polysaccharide export with SLBB domain
MKKYLLIAFILLPVISFAQIIETETRFSSGDVIEIRYFYTPELNVVQTIRPDGNIFLQLIGEVNAKGKTPLELKREIQKLYRPYMQEVDIAIIVQSLSERYIYVGGQVFEPGVILMERQRPFTALEALMKAGGINTELASYENVVILRHENGKWKHIELELENVLLGNTDNPTYMQHLDILFVPQKTIFRRTESLGQ